MSNVLLAKCQNGAIVPGGADALRLAGRLEGAALRGRPGRSSFAVAVRPAVWRSFVVVRCCLSSRLARRCAIREVPAPPSPNPRPAHPHRPSKEGIGPRPVRTDDPRRRPAFAELQIHPRRLKLNFLQRGRVAMHRCRVDVVGGGAGREEGQSLSQRKADGRAGTETGPSKRLDEQQQRRTTRARLKPRPSRRLDGQQRRRRSPRHLTSRSRSQAPASRSPPPQPSRSPRRAPRAPSPFAHSPAPRAWRRFAAPPGRCG